MSGDPMSKSTDLGYTENPLPAVAGSTARTEAQAREFGPREEASPYVQRCRNHWHAGFDKGASYSDVESATAAGLRVWAESVSAEDVHLLETLAVEEEDRFNQSGTYIPNETPGILRRIARDFVRYRALAATTEVAPAADVDSASGTRADSRSTPDALTQTAAALHTEDA
jgi:hypothetical protein